VQGRLYVQTGTAAPFAPFLKRAIGYLWLIDIFAHNMRQDFYTPRFWQFRHSVHFPKGKNVTVILYRDQAPILHFVIFADNTPNMQSPYPVGIFLVIPQLTERDTQFRRPGRIWQVHMGPSLPYSVPTKIYGKLIGNR